MDGIKELEVKKRRNGERGKTEDEKMEEERTVEEKMEERKIKRSDGEIDEKNYQQDLQKAGRLLHSCVTAPQANRELGGHNITTRLDGDRWWLWHNPAGRHGAGPLLRHTTEERLLRHASAEGRRGADRCCATPSQRSGYCVTPSLRKELARCSVTPPLRDGGGWLTAASHLHRHRGTAQRLDGYCDISPQRDARSGSSCRNTTYMTGAFRTIVYCSGYVSDLYVNSVLFPYVKYVCVCVHVCMWVYVGTS